MFEKENDILFLFPVLQFPILFPIRQFYLSINEDARINDRKHVAKNIFDLDMPFFNVAVNKISYFIPVLSTIFE